VECPNKFRFYRPPGHEFVSVPTLLSFVEEHPQQRYCHTISDNHSASSRSNSVAPCFSGANSLLSSRPTTPGLDVIDPRILGSLNICNEDENQAFSEQMWPQSPSLSLANQPVEDFVGNQVNGETKALRTDWSPTKSPSEQTGTPNDKRENQPRTQAEADDENLPRCGQSDAASVRGPFTRAKARSQPLPHFSDSKPRQELNVRENRKLLEFKSQNLTLRRIVSHFPDIDPAFLRQAWMDIKPSQRCTRSRTKRKKG
jgi:hypothetical protein